MGDNTRFENTGAIENQLRQEADMSEFLAKVEQGKVVEIGGNYAGKTTYRF